MTRCSTTTSRGWPPTRWQRFCGSSATACGRDPTVHPFATAISPADIRITTRFDEAYLGAAVWSVIHEAGHGMYENGIPRRLWRSPLSSPASLAFHESQSRMWENWVGRGRPYLERLHPRLRELFPEQLGAVDAEQLYRA